MQKSKRVRKGMCLALAGFFLASHAPVAVAATPASTERVVTGAELYNAMSARAAEEATTRASVQQLLARSEVRQVAARAGLDLQRAQAAVSVLSGEELQRVADQAQRVDQALAGGSSLIITSTMLIIGLLVLIILLVV